MDEVLSKGQVVVSRAYFNSDDRFEIVSVDRKTSSLWSVHYRSLRDPKVTKDLPLRRKNIDQLEFIGTRNLEGDGERVVLGLQARLIRLFQYTDHIIDIPLTIQPHPHQELAVSQMIDQLPVRFMLADEAGAGKTIMAGMLLQQLRARKQADRTLIIVPPILLEKWKKEMENKFGVDFQIITSDHLNGNSASIAWGSDSPFLALGSIDLLKRKEHRENLETINWDFVVIDEAHKMSARIEEKRGRADTIVETIRYKLGKVVQEKANHLLLMSATPHKGELDSFSFLMSLLDPLVMDEINAEKMQDLINAQSRLSSHRFLRRMKEHMIDKDGNPLFKSRRALTWTFSLEQRDPRGYRLYEDITDYIRNIYGKGITSQDGRTRTVIGFVKQIFQRRLASSTYAVFRTLENRLTKVNEKLEELNNRTLDSPDSSNSFDEFADLSEEKREIEEAFDEFADLSEEERESKEKKLIGEVLNFDPNALKEERRRLEELIDDCNSVLSYSDDPKIETLREALETYPDEKIVVFTEYKDTLDYIKRRLAHYTSVDIHGGIPFKKRIKAMADFWIPLNEGGPRVMLATEAAGEGIDLEIATVLVNYDIPWNPNRLEQRMGRIHRIGQQKPVIFINIVAEDTREGYVLTKLFDKLKTIGDTIGEDKVFDVISDLYSERALTQSIMSDDFPKEGSSKLDREIDRNYKNINRNELNIVDLARRRSYDEQLARRLSPQYTQSFLYKSLKYLGARVEEEDDQLKVVDLPSELRYRPEFTDIVKNGLPLIINLKNSPESIEDVTEKPMSLTSDSFASLLDYVQELSSIDVKEGTFLFDPYTLNAYCLWFFETAITRTVDGKKEDRDRRIIAFKSSEGVEEYDPRGVINLRVGSGEDFESINKESYISLADKNEEEVWEALYDYMDSYKSKYESPLKELWNARLRAGKETMHSHSNVYNDIRSRDQVNELKVKEAWEKYERSRKAYENLEREQLSDTDLDLDIPTLMCKVVVLPKVVDNLNIDVENRAMEHALKYEEEQGRLPIDVSTRGRGCDIESTAKGTDEVRYIEVKGRSSGVPVMLEETEIIQAERFGDRYWLYLYVFDSDDSVEFMCINNPIEKLPLRQIVRSSVSISEVRNATEIA